jgi:hypothetical protein
LRVHALGIPHQRQAGGFAARVEFDAKRLQGAARSAAVGEPDDKRHQAVNARAAARQQ